MSSLQETETHRPDLHISVVAQNVEGSGSLDDAWSGAAVRHQVDVQLRSRPGHGRETETIMALPFSHARSYYAVFITSLASDCHFRVTDSVIHRAIKTAMPANDKMTEKSILYRSRMTELRK
jgi:hypothetical protein